MHTEHELDIVLHLVKLDTYLAVCAINSIYSLISVQYGGTLDQAGGSVYPFKNQSVL